MAQAGGVLGSLTGRGAGLLLALLAIAFAGAVAGSWRGAAVSAAAVAALMLVLLEGHVFAARLAAARGLEVRWEPETPMVDGRPARVRVVLVNGSYIPVGRVEVVESLPRHFRHNGGRAWVVRLPALSEASIEYTVVPVVGSHEWGPLRLRVESPLGLYAAILELGRGRRVRVYAEPLRAPARLGGGGWGLGGGGGRAGAGTVFMAVREYVPGDELRRVDWKATARTGRLVVKVFEAEEAARLDVVLDATPALYKLSRPGGVGVSWAASAAMVLAVLASRLGGRLRLTLVQWDGRVYSTGWLSGGRIVGEARRLVSSLEWPPGEAGCSARRLAAVPPPPRGGRVVRVVVSDLCLSSSPASYVSDLAGGGASVLVVVPPLDLQGRAYEAYVARVARELGRAGVSVVDWRGFLQALTATAGGRL